MLTIRALRLENGWSQGYVAKCLGLTCAHISDIENGKAKPSYGVLLKLMELFECSDPRELFAERG